ncbi:MAG: type II toxin-antitoxin system VapC family toxin [Actinomycetota bacterium]|nr:type II toxin-antitoxin system VapC family toxin [Actinomycetota bacterium]
MRGAIDLPRAEEAKADFHDLAIRRYGHEALSARVWELCDNLTAYNAVFLALSEALGAPLVTCDTAFAKVKGSSAGVELYGAPRRKR